MKKFLPVALLTILVLCILFAIIVHPATSIKGASNGLSTWFNIVVPSLLPFFIISEILIRIGFVKFIGQLLEPLIKILFNVPGVGGFSFSISIVSGYPLGAKIVSDLRQKKIISKFEADRMICFSSTSGPLFMIGTIATGMLNNPPLAPLIIYPHYLGAITLGLLMRFYKKAKVPQVSNRQSPKKNFKSEISNIKIKSSIGYLLASSIQNSLNTLILIGGFMIFYSVLVELIFASNSFNTLIDALNNSSILDINIDILKGFISGLFEITTGCNIISNTKINTLYQVMIISFLIGWGGFSIHSQALNFISHTDINIKLYILAKILHGLLASFYCFILYIIKYNTIVKPSFVSQMPITKSIYPLQWYRIFVISNKIALLAIISMLICSIIISSMFKILKKD